jgi:hypothetical protein
LERRAYVTSEIASVLGRGTHLRTDRDPGRQQLEESISEAE